MSTDSNNLFQPGMEISPPPYSVRRTEDSGEKHSSATRWLHWGTVVAIVIAVAAIYLRETTEDKWWRQVLIDVHRQLGLLVLLGVGFRLAVRYTKGLADHAGQMHFLARWAALLTHVALYALLVALPLLGWAASNAHSIHLNFFGILQIPDLVHPDSDLSDTLDDYHKWGSWTLGALVLMHAFAALWHHYVRKDAVLSAMLPGRRAR